MKKNIILNYDLGIESNYKNLYSFLDELNAKEIGVCSVTFEMEFSRDNFETVFNEMKEKIWRNLKINDDDSYYIIAVDNDGEMKGGFLFNYKKRNTWRGFNIEKEETFDIFK